MNGNHFKYSHWLRFNTRNIKQWEELKNYKEKYDCDMTLFYYDYMPHGDKIVKINCNQSHEEFDLDTDLAHDNSFKKIKCKPTNCTPHSKSIYYFFEKYLGIKEEDIKEVNKRNNYNTEEFLPVDVLEEFGNMKNIDFFYNLMKRENWQIVKVKRDRTYLYQLYFGKGKQVDNRYEYCYAQFQGKGRFKERLSMFVNAKKKEEEINLRKYMGRKLNFFQTCYTTIDGEKMYADIKFIGLVLGINNKKVDMYDYKKPIGEQFYTIELNDFLKDVYDGKYKVNRNMLNWYEKLENRKYQMLKLEKLVYLYNSDLNHNQKAEPTIKSIDIKQNDITITYQKYSSKLDKYISCDIKKSNAKYMVTKFSTLDVYNHIDVYNYVSKLTSTVNLKEVNKLLKKEEEKQMSKKKSILEEEIELDI